MKTKRRSTKRVGRVVGTKLLKSRRGRKNTRKYGGTVLPLLEEKILYIWFHSLGCGHCINMATEWNKFKDSELKKGGIKFIEIEASDKSQFDEMIKTYDLKVDGYPTMYRIKRGNGNKFSKCVFDGPRTSISFQDNKYWISQL